MGVTSDVSGSARPASSGVVRWGWSLVTQGAGLGWRLVQRQAPPALTAGPWGRAVLGGRTRAAVHSAGRAVAPTSEALERAFPHATGRLLILLPDSTETERVWSAGVESSESSYGSRLARLLDWTPVHVRAPAPGPTPDGAASLAALLQNLVDHWPEPVERIAVLAHGDGGLAFRAAAGVVSWGSAAWQRLVSNVVLLDTPHLVAADAGGATAVSRHLDEELAGVVTADRVNADIDPIEHASYVVITRRTRLDRSLVGTLLGNVLWWRHRGRWRRPEAHHLFPTAAVVQVVDGSTPLTNHPEVQQALLDWLV